MGTVKPPPSAKLICGILACDETWLGHAREELKRSVGPIESASDVWAFRWTSYYNAETGEHIVRQFVSFVGRVDPAEIARIKLLTNSLETRLAERTDSPVPRPVNLDPGYIMDSKLVLATTKDYAHRVYLGQGIYAEVTLHWQEGQFEPWPWTYADYKSGEYRAFFTEVREALRHERNA